MNNKRRTKLDPRGKLIWWLCLFITAMAICYLLAPATGCKAAEVLPAPLPDSAILPELRESLNVCRDTPEGVIKPGADITKALQWACDNAHQHQRAIAIPAGTWLLSETVTTPYRSGFTLLGAGVPDPDTNSYHRGVGTILEWASKDSKPMICYTGSAGRVGNFTLDGKGKASIGLLIDKKDLKGLGTGKTIFERLDIENVTYCVQVGGNRWTDNCDEMVFEWLDGSGCEAVYHGENAMGMAVIIKRLRNGGKYGLLMKGGGHIWVQSSLTTTWPSTLLRIPDTSDGFGPNNAFFRLSQTKVDKQSGDDFTLVDCDEPAEIRILVDGGILSNTGFVGTFAKLHGSNFLHVTDFSSTFDKIEGKRHRNWGTPTVLLEGDRVWGKKDPSELFVGEVNYRLRDCTRTDGTWLDVPEPTSVKLIETGRRLTQLEAELKRLRGARVESELVLPVEVE